MIFTESFKEMLLEYGKYCPDLKGSDKFELVKYRRSLEGFEVLYTCYDTVKSKRIFMYEQKIEITFEELLGFLWMEK